MKSELRITFIDPTTKEEKYIKDNYFLNLETADAETQNKQLQTMKYPIYFKSNICDEMGNTVDNMNGILGEIATYDTRVCLQCGDTLHVEIPCSHATVNMLKNIVSDFLNETSLNGVTVVRNLIRFCDEMQEIDLDIAFETLRSVCEGLSYDELRREFFETYGPYYTRPYTEALYEDAYILLHTIKQKMKQNDPNYEDTSYSKVLTRHSPTATDDKINQHIASLKQ